LYNDFSIFTFLKYEDYLFKKRLFYNSLSNYAIVANVSLYIYLFKTKYITSNLICNHIVLNLKQKRNLNKIIKPMLKFLYDDKYYIG
jgi:hypothetical protein